MKVVNVFLWCLIMLVYSCKEEVRQMPLESNNGIVVYLDNEKGTSKELLLKSLNAKEDSFGVVTSDKTYQGKVLMELNRISFISNLTSDTCLLFDFGLKEKESISTCIESIELELSIDSIFVYSNTQEKVYKFKWVGLSLQDLTSDSDSYIDIYYSNLLGIIGLNAGETDSMLYFYGGVRFDSSAIEKLYIY